MSNKVKHIYKDRTKSWKVVCNGETISKHITFWHAQNHIPKLFRQNRIDNSYEIEPIN